MRLLLTLGTLVVAGCASTPSVGDEADPADRCESTDCFNQLQIRDFEVIDQTTLIVFVGEQECPFLVELTGTFCDITFLPGFDVVFRPNNRRMAREPGIGIPGGLRTSGNVSYARVCANDLDMGIASGPFTSAGGAPLGSETPDGLSCRIQDVSSLTDDERLEIYVENSIAPPPPPFGTGRVAVPESANQGAGNQRTESAPDGQSGDGGSASEAAPN